MSEQLVSNRYRLRPGMENWGLSTICGQLKMDVSNGKEGGGND